MSKLEKHIENTLKDRVTKDNLMERARAGHDGIVYEIYFDGKVEPSPILVTRYLKKIGIQTDNISVKTNVKRYLYDDDGSWTVDVTIVDIFIYW